ncbi:MOSC domain-containing protein [Paenibacillus sp. FSL R5-0527]|uniref:MOSC domain-containing protein n=1 Tax=Paenibacillus sp. FSL R5-0527 TaxID=2975321 RepID=UPI004048E7ED
MNFEGDGQGDLVHHGGREKAVCVYPYDHYPFWENELQKTLDYGAFGENLTIRGYWKRTYQSRFLTNRIMHHEKDDLAGIKKILEVEELSVNWRATFVKRLEGIEANPQERLAGDVMR